MKKIALTLALAVAAPAALAQFPSMPKIDTRAAEAQAKAKADEAAKAKATEVKAEAKEALKVDVVKTALATGKHTSFAAALKASDLVPTLEGAGPFTVFAPDDAAFAKIPAKDLADLLADKAKVSAVLKHHVVAGKITAKQIKAGKVKTLAGTEVDIALHDGKVMFGSAHVTTTDLDATNGVVHSIDAVILH
ncbi:MAG TPA: fasciclin domain-containing protein [Myxococcota bacterium]